MTVIKLSSSGKAFQVVDDFGNVYQCSIISLKYLLDGKVKSGFTLLNRLSFKVDESRFPKSEVWGAVGEEAVRAGEDSFSVKGRKELKSKSNFVDKVVF